MTETFAEQGTELFGIDVSAVALGALNTRLLDEALNAGPEVIGQKTFENMKSVTDAGGAPLGKAPELCVWLGSPASNGITGKLISAAWVPWSDFQDHRDDIDNSDIYTLRRIVRADSGTNWGR